MHPQESVDSKPAFWWRPRMVPEGNTLHCHIGPLELDIYHGGDEWSLIWTMGEETDADLTTSLELREGALEGEQVERHVFGDTSGNLQLRPLLLDRSVVIRPRQAVFVPSGEVTTLYLSSPLCISVDVGESPLPLREFPMLRLSDTWFGANTREGELCYSGRTRARHHLAELPRRPHRAITPVRIENHAEASLPLEKLSLPVPNLSLYGAEDGSLWTQSVSLTRTANSDLAALQISHGPPEDAGKVELISGPRQEAQKGGLVRAFSVFFSS